MGHFSMEKSLNPGSVLGGNQQAEQLRRLMESPLTRELNNLGGIGDLLGLGETTDRLLGDIDRGKQAAKDAYRNSLERLQAETATNLARSASVCGCLADAAISETRTEWAIFTGTVGLVRPSPITAFGRKMTDLHDAGRCSPAQKAVR